MRLPDHSRSRLSAWIKSGHVTVDDNVVRPAFVVRVGQCIKVDIPAPPASTVVPQQMDLDFVYQDEHLAVVDKPAGLVVHPGAGHPDGTLVNGLAAAFSLSPIGLPERPGIVHRIDAGTTGLLVVARDEGTHLGLARQFSAHTVERRYLALAWDHDLADEGRIETRYGRHPKDRRKFTGIGHHDRHAVTHWRVLERLGPCAWVELRLETGRTHQIRVHMSEQGCPLLGDVMYGRKRKLHRPAALRTLGFELGLRRQALHAASLGFEHPRSGEALRFESPVPADLASVLAALREAHT